MSKQATRILTLIWPSNYPNFKADSIYTFNKILFSALLESDANVEVIAVGSPDMPELHPRVNFIPLKLGTSKLEIRFGFCWNEIRQVLKNTKPDLCIVNMPEQAAALAILIKDDLRLDCKLISYVHYIPTLPSEDDQESIAYEWWMNEHKHGPLHLMRLLEGVLASDLVLSCSEFGLSLLRRATSSLLRSQTKMPPMGVLHPPVDFNEIRPVPEMLATEVPRFVYNHRLYDEYGTHRIFNLLNDIHEGGAGPFEVLVTNPTHGRDAERSRLNPVVDQNLALLRDLPFVLVQHYDDRTSYIRAIKESRAGIAPAKPHALWSMSVVDVLACGRPVLSFDMAAFKEIGIPRDLLVHHDAEFKDSFCRLLANKLPDEQQHYFRSIAEQFSGHRAAQRFLSLATEA